VSSNTRVIILFACFALGLPIFAMQTNPFERTSVHGCTGVCYEEWKASR